MKNPKLSSHDWTILYFQNLGMFIHVFAATEIQMRLLLWHFADVSHYKARALFSGVKTDQAITHINKLTEKHSQKIKDDLSCIFKQLKLVNGVRNHILHQEVKHIKKTRVILTNARTVFRKSEIKKIPVSPKILRSMTDDLLKIQAHIRVYIDGKSPAFKMYAPALLSASWQYKPPLKQNQPKPLRPKKRHRNNLNQKHTDPPESSLA